MQRKRAKAPTMTELIIGIDTSKIKAPSLKNKSKTVALKWFLFISVDQL